MLSNCFGDNPYNIKLIYIYTMKIILLLSNHSSSCRQAEQIWLEACQQYGLTIDIHQIATRQGAELVEALNLRSFPVLIVDNRPRVVGKPDLEHAVKLLKQFLEEEQKRN